MFQLENTGQVLQKARILIDRSKSRITLSADSFPLDQLSTCLAQAADRGVSVLVNDYNNNDIPGCDII